jgi:hypothetical protein
MADILPINTTLREVIEGEYVEQYFTAQLSTNETLKINKYYRLSTSI